MIIKLPFIEIGISRNIRFYANINWILYKLFHKHRKYPCGQRKKYMYCGQPWKVNRVYVSKDKHEYRCKVCNSIRVLSNKELRLEDFENNTW